MADFDEEIILNSQTYLRIMELDMKGSEKMQGKVKWFDEAKGFGFIDRGKGKDVFVHYSQIKGKGYRTLAEGERVEFDLYHSEHGIQAKNVVKLKVG